MKPLDRIEIRNDGDHYFLSHQEVTKAEYRAVYPKPVAGGVGEFDGAWKRPLKSNALAVGRKQIKEATEDAIRKGVPVEFTPTGEPVFTSRKQRADYCKAYGFFDKSAGYGDAADGSFRGDRLDQPKEEYGL